MTDLIKQNIIATHENYIILHNGQIVDTSLPIINLHFEKDIDLKVIHLVDQDTSIDYYFGPNINVRLEEVFYKINASPTVKINLAVSEHANVDYLSIMKTDNGSAVTAFVNTTIASNAYINYKTLSTLNASGQIVEHLYLNEDHAKADIKHVIVNSSSQEQSLTIDVHHNAPATLSSLKNYGITNNNSKLTINTTGIVKRHSTQAVLKQNTKGLILDLNSQLSANPILIIDDFDCMANHGASIGAIDDEELYYLMSRGLTKEQSEKLIVESFINPFLVEVKEGKFQDYLKYWIKTNI